MTLQTNKQMDYFSLKTFWFSLISRINTNSNKKVRVIKKGMEWIKLYLNE